MYEVYEVSQTNYGCELDIILHTISSIGIDTKNIQPISLRIFRMYLVGDFLSINTNATSVSVHIYKVTNSIISIHKWAVNIVILFTPALK